METVVPPDWGPQAGSMVEMRGEISDCIGDGLGDGAGEGLGDGAGEGGTDPAGVERQIQVSSKHAYPAFPFPVASQA